MDRPGERSLEATYLAVRKLIGWLGLLMPAVLVGLAAVLSGQSLQPTISDYYHTAAGDVFVGILCAIGAFLCGYRGYAGKGNHDNLITNVAGGFAVAVAILPTTPSLHPTPRQELVGIAHYVSAAILFLLLAAMSAFVFTKTGSAADPGPERRAENRFYRGCAVVIVSAIVAIGAYSVLPGSAHAALDGARPKFWLEALAVMSFGASWMVKGSELARRTIARKIGRAFVRGGLTD